MNKWLELKGWVQRQYRVEDIRTPAQRLINNFFKQVKDKMWSLEKEEKKDGENKGAD